MNYCKIIEEKNIYSIAIKFQLLGKNFDVDISSKN